MWVFLLLSVEAMKTYRSNPHFSLGPYKIPTWTSPLVLALVVYILVPNTSLLGHLCGCAVGFLCKPPPLSFPNSLSHPED